MSAHRDLAPFLKMFRNLLLGREYRNSLRFQDEVATRSPPPPELPDGPSHKLFSNYYFTRDGRHEAKPPASLFDSSSPKGIAAGDSKSSDAIEEKPTWIVPGKPYVWKKAEKSDA